MGVQESDVLEGEDGVQEEDAVEATEMADDAPEPVDGASGVSEKGPVITDLNTATEEELRQLPGIGAVLAARIVDYRREVGPFGTPEEVKAVSGVSQGTYDLLADQLSASSVEPEVDLVPEAEMLEEELVLESEFPAEGAEDLLEPEPVPEEMEIQEPEEPEGVPVLVSEPAEEEIGMAEELETEAEHVVKAPPLGPEPPLVEIVQARYGCARLLLTGLLGAILGALLALLCLFLVNGTLDFQSAAVRTAQDEVLRMEGVVGALDMKVAELEERVGALQELETRLAEAQAALRDLSADMDDLKQRFVLLAETQDALRQEFTNLREDMDGLAAHVSALDRRLSDLETQVSFLDRKIEILGESIRRFDAFLLGLGALLNETQGDLQPTPTPWITPLPTLTTGQPPTLRPQVTVIPLATLTPPSP